MMVVMMKSWFLWKHQSEPQFLNSSMNNLITNPFHSTRGEDDKFSSMLTSEPQYDFINGNNLDSEQFNSSGGDDDKLSTN